MFGSSRPTGLQRSTRNVDGSSDFWLEVAKLTFTIGFGVYSAHLVRKMISVHTDAVQGTAEQAEAARKHLADKLKRPELEKLELNAHEQRIALDVLSADELGVTFADIGGMEAELEEVSDNVVLPMKMWKEYGHSLSDMIACPAGVLLYGKPGTGKTMTAKAVAFECRASFINIKAGAVVDKWMGESEKLVEATFSLARKLAPCVIFIDEIDTILRKRSGLDSNQGSLATMQGTLLSEWDGVKGENADSHAAPVVVLGATNRPMDLDAAILRRMPVQIKTKMPDVNGRMDVLQKQLNGDTLADDVDIRKLALRTEHFSGSDLKELVRVTMLSRTKRSIKEANQERLEVQRQYDKEIAERDAKAHSLSLSEGGDSSRLVGSSVMPPPPMKTVHPRKMSITAADFEVALAKTKPTGEAATDYTSDLLLEEQRNRADIIQNVIERMNGGSDIPQDLEAD